MALQKNKVSLPFGAGLDTKTDDKQKDIGRLDRLKNVIFDTLRQYRKRNGYSLILTKLLNDTKISNAKSLTKFNNELCLINDTNFYSYSSSIQKWTDKGAIFSAFPTSTSIIRNSREQKNIDAISQDNINVYVYQDATGVRCTVKDSQSGNVLLNNTLISATGINPKVSTIQNSVHVIYVDGTDLKYRKINLVNPSTVEPEATIVSDVDATDKKFDAESYEDRIILGYNSSTTVKVLGILSDGTFTSALGLTGETCPNGISIDKDSNDRVIVTFSDNVDVKVAILPRNLSSPLLAATSIETVSNVVAMAAADHSSGEYTIYYEIPDPANDKNYMVKKNTITLAGAVGTPSVLIRSVGLASKIFKYENALYTTVIHKSTFQSTYFVIDENSNLIAKISPLLAGDFISENGVPKVTEVSIGEFLIPSQIKGRIVTDEGTFNSLLGVNSTLLDFEISSPYQNETLNGNLHITGGILKQYDGSCIVEHGFNVFPEDLAAGSTSTVGGTLSDGQYQYVAVYAWTDSQGQLHRSAPSLPLTVTLSGGTSTQQQDIEIPTLRLTQKENVVVEVYRTEANGTIFYRISDVASPLFNDATVDTVTFTDNATSDTDLISGEILYTTGGVLDNIAAPASKIIESFNDRIFLAGLEDPNRLEFSKITDENEPVEFNDTFYKLVNDEGGEITALHVMDDKLIIFKQDALYYITGDGPNDLGEQDTFIEPELISSEIGCTEIDSVVLTPLGLMFKSRKGIYLLTRALGLQYVGAAVEEFNNLTVTSGIVVPEDNQVRFTTQEGDCLVYNYFSSQWATFDNHRGLSAVTIQDDYYYLRPDGAIYKEDDSSFTDNGSSINMVLESGWISFAGVQGFQRVYKLFLLGKYFSKHKIRIRIAYDFKEAYIHEKIVDTADFTSDIAYGDSSPYGSESVYGGSGNVLQLRLDMKKQKCQAIKFRIEEIQDDSLGQGLSLSNIFFEVGVKRGPVKIDSGRKYGTTSA